MRMELGPIETHGAHMAERRFRHDSSSHMHSGKNDGAQ